MSAAGTQICEIVSVSRFRPREGGAEKLMLRIVLVRYFFKWIIRALNFGVLIIVIFGNLDCCRFLLAVHNSGHKLAIFALPLDL
jgi:hypothetical protein